jgi:hypothetical protein
MAPSEHLEPTQGSCKARKQEIGHGANYAECPYSLSSTQGWTKIA